MTRNSPRLILASASPRRRELLSRLGVDFDVAPAEVDERTRPGENPEEAAYRLASEKARAAGGKLVLAADTIVVGDAILGKPQASEQAVEMLRTLRGRAHRVLTGVTLRSEAVELTEVAETIVHMRAISEEEIAAYVASGSPMDKAGAYGIQDREAAPVEAIEGCYYNVVGLPVCVVGELLRRADFPIAEQSWFGARDWRRCACCRQDWPALLH